MFVPCSPCFQLWTFSRLLGELREVQWDKVANEGLREGLRLYIRDFWNQLDTGTFLLVMAAAAVRINNASREEDWEGSFVDVLPRNT